MQEGLHLPAPIFGSSASEYSLILQVYSKNLKTILRRRRFLLLHAFRKRILNPFCERKLSPLIPSNYLRKLDGMSGDNFLAKRIQNTLSKRMEQEEASSSENSFQIFGIDLEYPEIYEAELPKNGSWKVQAFLLHVFRETGLAPILR